MAQEQRRTGDQPERRSRASGRSRTTQNRGGRKKGRAATSFALLYVVFVIGISALLACIGWVAANDVLALNKEQKTVTVTISSEEMWRTCSRRTDLLSTSLCSICLPPSLEARMRWCRGPLP